MRVFMAAGLFVLCATAYADTTAEPGNDGFDFYFGMSVWYTNAEGSINVPDYFNYTINLEKSDIEKGINTVFYTGFEHPVRYLPDVLLSQSNIKQDGQGELNLASLTPLPIEGYINLNHTDLTLYYNVYSGTGFVDLGLTARSLNGELYLKLSSTGVSSSSDLSAVLGLLYLKTGINLPLDGASMGLALNAGDNGRERSADASLYMQYETDYGLGATYGYRYFNTDIESEGVIAGVTLKLHADFDVYGPFATIYYHY